MSAPKNSSAKPRGLSARVKKLLGMFNGDDHVLILIAADPDALGSALAFKRLLWRRVAGVTIASISEISRPDNQAMIRLLQIPMEPIEKIDPRAFSKKVMVDSQPHHSPRFPEPPYDVIIDHHPPSTNNKPNTRISDRPTAPPAQSSPNICKGRGSTSPSAWPRPCSTASRPTPTASAGPPCRKTSRPSSSSTPRPASRPCARSSSARCASKTCNRSRTR